MATMAERFHRRFGFRVFKLKAGVLPPEQEVAALRAINERFSGRYALRIDPNARWTVETAIRAAEPMKGLPLEYYEDPVAGQVDMARVRLATGLVMSTNMCVTRFEHVPSALRHKCIDVVLGDHHGWGGITAFQALGEICTVAGWKLSQHSNNHAGITMAAMTHVGAAVPQLTLASDTHYPWLPDGADIIQGDNLRFQHGRLKVPAGPGLGVELDQDKLARAHEIYRKCGMRSRDDGATMQRFEPGWRRTLY
jgi:glucarate dehydratase